MVHYSDLISLLDMSSITHGSPFHIRLKTRIPISIYRIPERDSLLISCAIPLLLLNIFVSPFDPIPMVQVTLKSLSDDGYSQDSDFDSDSSTLESSDANTSPGVIGTLSKSPRGSPQYQCLDENDEINEQSKESKPRKQKFIIRQNHNYSKNIPTQKNTLTSKTFSLSRLKLLSQPRIATQKEQLPMPPPTTDRRKSTRESCMNFLNRQEALEKSRKNKLARKKMELDYNAKITKRTCPRCHNQQSFDEVSSGRMACPFDGETYAMKTFSMKSFERRMFRSSCKKQQKLDEIRSERMQVLQKAEATANALRVNGKRSRTYKN